MAQFSSRLIATRHSSVIGTVIQTTKMTELKLRPLSAELRHVAQTELHESESRIGSDVAALRDWMAKQPHLHARQDDQFLVAFLRGCKYSLEKAKSKLDHYYTIKTMVPEVFAQQHVDDKTLAVCRTGSHIRLPKPMGAGGPRILLTDYSKFDPKQFKLIDMFRYQTLLMDWQIREDDNCIIAGYIQIVNLSKMSLSFIGQLDFTLIKKLGVFADKAQPTRLKGVHLINCPKESVALVNMAKSLMSEKLSKRFYLYKNLEQLYEVVPREYLPEEFGGKNGRISDIQAETEQYLLRSAADFEQENAYKVNEQLRPGKQLNAHTLFGVEGSFRKLDID